MVYQQINLQLQLFTLDSLVDDVFWTFNLAFSALAI